ncbi:MAG: 16S rRNA (cytosine(1402)-N(4))-methyltransferase RsmH [Gammaproteobacteria bacterium]
MHTPVLLDEVIQYLAIKPHGIYVDGTFGRGGHAQAILQHLNAEGRLFATDKDWEAIQIAKHQPVFQDQRFDIQQGSFTQLYALLLEQHSIGNVDGILLDLGVSSPQLDTAERGFSFTHDGPLDMRMDNTQSMDAKRWLQEKTEAEMAQVFKQYGEERFARRIAKAIAQARQQSPIETTKQLADIVAKAHPRWEPHKHPATRTFQAIRIAVNSELTELATVLQQSLDILKPGGRLLVISFHSLEDQIVKDFITEHATTAHIPKDLPLTHTALQARLRLKRINGAIRPSEAECRHNIRARSAILRIMEKLQ